MVSGTSAASVSVASGIQTTAFRKSGTSSAAASIASRVFPDPPGARERHETRAIAHESKTSATSRSRPTNELAGLGRFVFERVLSGGKRSSPSW